MADFVDGASVAMTEDGEFLEVTGRKGVTAGGGR